MGPEALSAGWQRIQLYIYLRDHHRRQVILIVEDNNKNSKLEQ